MGGGLFPAGEGCPFPAVAVCVGGVVRRWGGLLPGGERGAQRASSGGGSFSPMGELFQWGERQQSYIMPAFVPHTPRKKKATKFIFGLQSGDFLPVGDFSSVGAKNVSYGGFCPPVRWNPFGKSHRRKKSSRNLNNSLKRSRYRFFNDIDREIRLTIWQAGKPLFLFLNLDYDHNTGMQNRFVTNSKGARGHVSRSKSRDAMRRSKILTLWYVKSEKTIWKSVEILRLLSSLCLDLKVLTDEIMTSSSHYKLI